MKHTHAIIHFSGGSDSTLCAALMAEQCEKVHLLTYDRISFLGSKNYTKKNFLRLCKIYGEDRFVRKIVPIDRLHRFICYENYLSILSKFGLGVTSLVFSKLAMHFFSAAYALRNKISLVADGAVPYMRLYPDQNEQICCKRLKVFYENLGITYVNPVYHIQDKSETMLYQKGVTTTPFVRGTAEDKQVFYLEQVLLALFLKYYLTMHGKDGYEEHIGKLFQNRIDCMAMSLHHWMKSEKSILDLMEVHLS